MLAKSDKKFILDSIKENNGILVKEMVNFFNATNKAVEEVREDLGGRLTKVENRLDGVEENMEKVLDALKTEDRSIDNHERRIGKLEDKVFATTTTSS